MFDHVPYLKWKCRYMHGLSMLRIYSHAKLVSVYHVTVAFWEVIKSKYFPLYHWKLFYLLNQTALKDECIRTINYLYVKLFYLMKQIRNFLEHDQLNSGSLILSPNVAIIILIQYFFSRIKTDGTQKQCDVNSYLEDRR